MRHDRKTPQLVCHPPSSPDPFPHQSTPSYTDIFIYRYYILLHCRDFTSFANGSVQIYRRSLGGGRNHGTRDARPGRDPRPPPGKRGTAGEGRSDTHAILFLRVPRRARGRPMARDAQAETEVVDISRGVGVFSEHESPRINGGDQSEQRAQVVSRGRAIIGDGERSGFCWVSFRRRQLGGKKNNGCLFYSTLPQTWTHSCAAVRSIDTK